MIVFFIYIYKNKRKKERKGIGCTLQMAARAILIPKVALLLQVMLMEKLSTTT
jgi:hypothetical protein